MIAPVANSSIQLGNAPLDTPQLSFHQCIWVPTQKAALWVWSVALLVKDKIFSLFPSQKTALQKLASKVYAATISCYQKCKNAISSIPTFAGHYVVFQTIETWIPTSFKALANSAYCYLRDLFKTTDLQRQVEDLTAELKEVLRQIKVLEESRNSFREIGRLDQELLKSANQESKCVRERLQLASQRATLLEEEIGLLRTQIQLLQVQQIPQDLPDVDSSEPLTPNEIACILKELPPGLHHYFSSQGSSV